MLLKGLAIDAAAAAGKTAVNKIAERGKGIICKMYEGDGTRIIYKQNEVDGTRIIGKTYGSGSKRLKSKS